MSTLVGHSLGRYHILEQLGEGGMATVYKAYDTRLEADVAVKVIRTEQLAPSVLARALKRFEREAKALARLTHPNIIKVIDYGESEDRPYLVMEYLPGGTLKQRLKDLGKPMPWQEAIHLILPVAHALDFAHRQGLVHRDVKPSNILTTADGEPMLSDFGIAKLLDLEETVDLTGTSVAVGTPEYMAPEQSTSKTVDQRADIYALGIVFYEMVAGRKPYVADTPLAVLIKHASEPLPRPKLFAPDLPDAVERVLLKALAKQPADRYQTMGEFAAAMEKTVSSVQLPLISKREKSEKEEEKRLKPAAHEPPVARPVQWKRWLPLGILAALLVISLAIGAYVLKFGKRSIAPLAGSVTASKTTTLISSFTPTLISSPTQTPTLTATFTPTSLKVFPTATLVTVSTSFLPATESCDNSSYVADITVPDLSEIAPGAQFVKTWRVRNNGTCIWTSGYRLVFRYGGEGTNWKTVQPSYMTKNVNPGEEIDISVTLTAPFATGQYGAHFGMQNNNGYNFGVDLTAIIKVKGTSTP